MIAERVIEASDLPGTAGQKVSTADKDDRGRTHVRLCRDEKIVEICAGSRKAEKAIIASELLKKVS
jgi:hypothetical protein